MRVFLYEHCCASGADSSLRDEGWAMLLALAEDFQAIAGCEVWTMLDPQCPRSLGDVCRRVTPRSARQVFSELAGGADGTLVIAPETGGILADLNRAVTEVGGRLLGCSAEAVALAADKLDLARHWAKHRVPTPEVIDADNFPGFDVVLKPRDGAGSQATFLASDPNAWTECWRQARRAWAGDMLVQRFVPGQPASLAFLIGATETVSLPAATQLLSTDGRFHYLGGELPLPPPLAERALALATRAVACVPGLAGYVGVDLVLGADAGADFAIEINPRLTTSYLGLRQLTQTNLAQVMWELAEGKSPGPRSWRPGPVRFSPVAGQ